MRLVSTAGDATDAERGTRTVTAAVLATAVTADIGTVIFVKTDGVCATTPKADRSVSTAFIVRNTNSRIAVMIGMLIRVIPIGIAGTAKKHMSLPMRRRAITAGIAQSVNIRMRSTTPVTTATGAVSNAKENMTPLRLSWMRIPGTAPVANAGI